MNTEKQQKAAAADYVPPPDETKKRMIHTNETVGKKISPYFLLKKC